MTLAEIAIRGAGFAYRYGAEREMWIADLKRHQKAVESSIYTDDRGDPLLRIETFERDDFQYRDWSIMPEDDVQ